MSELLNNNQNDSGNSEPTGWEALQDRGTLAPAGEMPIRQRREEITTGAPIVTTEPPVVTAPAGWEASRISGVPTPAGEMPIRQRREEITTGAPIVTTEPPIITTPPPFVTTSSDGGASAPTNESPIPSAHEVATPEPSLK